MASHRFGATHLRLSQFMVYQASHARRHYVWRIDSSPTCRTAPWSSCMSTAACHVPAGSGTMLGALRSCRRLADAPLCPAAEEQRLTSVLVLSQSICRLI